MVKHDVSGTCRLACLGVVLTSSTFAMAGGMAVWANNGQDKIRQDELRLSKGQKVTNSVWDGETVKLFGARNETVAFCLVIETPNKDLTDVCVGFDCLKGPDGAEIRSRKATKKDLFNWVDRPIEVFYVRYLQVEGVGRLLYEPTYDERHVPKSLRLPYDKSKPKGWHRTAGKFEERPGAHKFYPDILVPIEAQGAFKVAKGTSQLVWVDVYIPKGSTAGVYKGEVTLSTAETGKRGVPVRLEVMPFELPDAPSQKTMVYYSGEDIFDRYFGKKWPQFNALEAKDQAFLLDVLKNHHKMAHRHRVSLIDGGTGLQPGVKLYPHTQWRHDLWLPILSGELFTPENGYAGTGVSVGNGVYSIGTYGSWYGNWKRYHSDGKNVLNEQVVWSNADRYVKWFKENSPQTQYFVYLKDEPHGKERKAEVETWAKWFKDNPGVGKAMPTMVTSSLITIAEYMPDADIGYVMWGDRAVWEPFMKKYWAEGKHPWYYNGKRPYNGSFATEDEGVALRVTGWTCFKMKVGRFFYWQSTHYKNSSHVKLETNVFQTAHTFGRINDKPHSKYGRTGNGYSNGDGVLLYPGTEKRFSEDDYGLDGPIPSMRLKLLRRGLQDVDYLTLAAKVDPKRVEALVQKIIPKVLWEVGVTDPKDPTWVHTDISWSTDPDVWEAARRQLADIILKK